MAVSRAFYRHAAYISSLSIVCPDNYSTYEEKLKQIYSTVKEFQELQTFIVKVGRPKDEPASWARCMRYAEIGDSVEKFMFMAAKSRDFSELDNALTRSEYGRDFDKIIMHMKLELYSLKRQEQKFITVLQLIKKAFFKHGKSNTLKSCVTAITFCATESQADLQDSAQNKLKELEDELVLKLRSARKQAGVSDDEYSLTVNLRRLYQLQLSKFVSSETLFSDMLGLTKDFSNLDDEVIHVVLLNMFLHIAWSLRSIDSEHPSEAATISLLPKRDNLMNQLEYFADSVLESWEQGTPRIMLCCTICTILSDVWSFFSEAKLSSTKLQNLGFFPSENMLKKFWKLCDYRLNAVDDDEDVQSESDCDEQEETEERKRFA